MAGPARRDLVWDAALRCLVSSPASIRLHDVQTLVEEEDVSDRTVRRTMNAMQALGWLEKEKEGGHYWYPGPKAREFLRVPSGETSAQRERLDRDDRRDDVDDLQDVVEETPDEKIARAVGLAQLPGDGELLERRREAFRTLLEFAREEGEVSPSEMKEEFYPDLEVGYGSDHSWWKNFVYPAFRDCELVESGGGGSHTWFYVG